MKSFKDVPMGMAISKMVLALSHYLFNRHEFPTAILVEDQGIFDSGCCRHMTGNKSYLTDYQDIDGGFVAFAGSPKGGKITGKGKIRTRKLDFEDLLDESQVLLKVPRQDNMYNFDLKNVVPSGGLTCLIVKATIDESNLWYRRLGYINFKTINKLVRGNLVRGLPSKLFQNDHSCVACQKGNQHKASCKTKLVSSITHPLQMLHMDLFEPTFVRSINHKIYCLVVTDDYSRCDNGTKFKNNNMNQFCGVKGIKREFSVARTLQQNGIAERKNKTLIEAARTMLADSLLPTTFWAEAINAACYVLYRVLVTKPHNKTPYELLLRSGPEWLFDIDSLTKSMNYEPVTIGNQTNGDVGIETNVNAGQARQEKVSDHEYILLPLMLSNSPLSLNTQSTDDKDADEVPDKGDDDKEGYANSTNRDSTASSSVSTVGPSINTASENINTGSPNINTASPIPNDLKADLKNLETTMNVSHIPTTRIYKDHPKDQIIRDINLATQTRRMTKISEENAMTLVDLPKGKRAIGTKWVYRNKKDERGIVVRNKARLVCIKLQGLDNAQEIPDEFYRGAHLLLRIAASTPMEPNKALVKDEETDNVDVHLYRSTIGSLMYLTAARPDITFVVCACARFQVTPKVTHLHALKRIFRYLKGQPKLGLWYPRDSPFDLEAFSDIDYAGASLDRKSTTGGQDSKIPQSSGPLEKVGDEAVHKELGDRMERAATIASSLEAEQDSGNINRTQSMTTLNEPSP
ncbi:putative ribonuclease H-like domain-containing protein [Tanacetum coccineum]